ncbi:MAG: hypothetical protein PUD44_00270, partial [Clostridiaceae bacterium]|nr:hypothetical protein [Clostridiaceae bacterium]
EHTVHLCLKLKKWNRRVSAGTLPVCIIPFPLADAFSEHTMLFVKMKRPAKARADTKYTIKL